MNTQMKYPKRVYCLNSLLWYFTLLADDLLWSDLESELLEPLPDLDPLPKFLPLVAPKPDIKTAFSPLIAPKPDVVIRQASLPETGSAAE